LAEVNGVSLRYPIAGKGDRSCCCMALAKPAACGSGHWLMEEAADQMIPNSFLNG
jgi:hypothetical protein